MINIKNKLILLIMFLLILISISYGIYKGIKAPPKENKTDSLTTNPLYKEEYKDRYLAYQEKNTNKSEKDIIIEVNIGLDNPPYTNVKNVTKFDNQLLVNKYNALPKDYVPENLEKLDEKYASANMYLTHDAKLSFEEMASAASKENLTIIAMSTYRSYSYQERLYNNYVKKDGQEKADTYSAKPGHSEHQTGLAVDVKTETASFDDFAKTSEYTWLKENAHNFGFILRYPKEQEAETTYQYEPWHYRYVGKKIAKYIYENNITYDRYYTEFLAK